MPIPAADTSEAPRRLLRDVVYDKMLAAIVEGTLEPGERLNDDALCSWLGVSRTPVREAITQLHVIGLVEIEANRFTKVASLDDALYAEASNFLAGLHVLGRQWGLDKLTAAERDDMGKRLRALYNPISVHELDAPKELLDLQGELVRASGNRLLIKAEEPLRTRVKFLSPRDPNGYDWQSVNDAVSDLRVYVESE